MEAPGDDVLDHNHKAQWPCPRAPQLCPSPCPQESAAARQLELGELTELAAFLGRVDPWYESTVNTLCAAIHKLAQMVGAVRGSREGWGCLGCVQELGG